MTDGDAPQTPEAARLEGGKGRHRRRVKCGALTRQVVDKARDKMGEQDGAADRAEADDAPEAHDGLGRDKIGHHG